MPRHCLTLNLKNDPTKIAEYKQHHEKIWPEVRDGLFAAGITDMEIYLNGNQLIMIMDVADDFSPERKVQYDSASPRIMEWEKLMGSYMEFREGANHVNRWAELERIFDLKLQ